MKVLKEIDDRIWESALQLARVTNTSALEVVKRADEIMVAFENLNEPPIQVSELIAKMPELPRSPAEIKKDIKHEKNPMRLKQLNKELNESYKHLRIADAWNKKR